MRTRPKITSIEIIQYELTLQDVAPEPTIGIPVYKPGSVSSDAATLFVSAAILA